MINSNDITITGGIFGAEGTTLKGVLNYQLNTLFGRNGSGKSTIARYLKNLGDNDIFVFDEDYIHDNMRIQDDGLKSIVMFGQDITTADSLNDLNSEINNLKDEVTCLSNDIAALTNDYNTAFANIRKNINDSKNSYTKRISLSIGKKNNVSKINDDTSLQQLIVDMHNTKTATPVSAQEVQDKAEKLGKATGKLLSIPIPSLDQLKLRLSEADVLLKKAIAKPHLSDADKHIVAIATDPSLGHYIREAKSILFPSKPSHCPLCQQPLQSAYLDDLFLKIESVLNKEADDFVANIDSTISQLVVEQFDSTNLSSLNYDGTSLYQAYQNLEKSVNQVIEALQKKKDNLYDPSSGIDSVVMTHHDDYNNELKKLSDKIEAFNNLVKDRNKQLDQFEKDNLRLAYQENQSDVEMFCKSLNSLLKKYKEKEQKETDIKDCEDKINQLNNKPNLEIAIDKINYMLGLVFFDNRITLHLENNKYIVKVHGEDVEPKRLSTGEQNVLAMSYFFAQLSEKSTEGQEYTKQMLVVVDDPISSFDEGNRVGMIVLLNSQFYNILQGNNNSKILVMTHDMRTLEDLNAGRKQTFYNIKKLNVNDDIYKGIHCRLCNKQIEMVTTTDSEYTQLINEIYAVGFDNAEVFPGLGNAIRRMLETYSTFNFKQGFDSKIKYIINNVWHSDDKTYLKSFCVRIALNRQSHAGEPNADVINYYTDDEKRQMARAAILLLYAQDKFHVKAYLGDKIYTKEQNHERVIIY